MLQKKNIKLGKTKFNLIIIILLFAFFIYPNLKSEVTLEGNFTDIKVLDKISSKNILIKLKNGQEVRHKDLLIKSMKCKNAEFDDNPEVTAYLQVSDLTSKKKIRTLYLIIGCFHLVLRLFLLITRYTIYG